MNFHNFPTTELADEYGNIDAQIKTLTERKDALRAELLARDVEKVEGQKWTVTVSTTTRTTYDDKAIRAALGADIVKSYERVSETTTLRTKPTFVLVGEAA